MLYPTLYLWRTACIVRTVPCCLSLITNEFGAALRTVGYESYGLCDNRSLVKVYTYNNGFMHAKTIIVDDKYATVGSVNQDYRSYDLNFEDNVFVYDRAFNKEMSDQFEKDMEQSTLLTPEMIKKQSHWLRFLQNFSRLLSPIL